MKTVNNLFSELKRTVLSPYFLACIILVCAICFTSSGYTDYSANKQYTIFEMMFMLGTEDAQTYDFSRECVSAIGYGAWAAQFLVILVSFSFVKIMCDERLYGQKRYYISRSGLLRYSACKLLSAIISAALVCFMGYMLFVGITYAVFPSVSTLPQNEQECFAITGQHFAKTMLRMCLVGASFVPLPFIIAAFTRNIYFSVCIPFLVQYMQRTAENKLIHAMFTSGNYSEKKQMLLWLVSHNSAELIAWGDTRYSLYAALLHTAVIFASFIIFYMAQKRRVDNGT